MTSSVMKSYGSSGLLSLPHQYEFMRSFESVFHLFTEAKLFPKNSNQINSIDFSKDGNTLISSSEDDSMVIYNCENGNLMQTINSKKYGVDLIQYTHDPDTAIHSSNKENDTIRLLSLSTKNYSQYFSGHDEKVVALCMSPVSDTFLSGSLDKTVRLWDLRTANSEGLMVLNGRPVVNFDPEGLLFAVGINRTSVKLYDIRYYEKGPFCTFELPQFNAYDWTGLKFSPNGKMIMIYSNGNEIYTIDAFSGNLLQTFQKYANETGLFEASFSPDSKFIFSGCKNGNIYCWSALTGKKKIAYKSSNTAPVQCLKFNPQYHLMASASTVTSFWIPKIVV